IGPGGKDPKEFWNRSFHPGEEGEKDRDREHEAEEKRPPTEISGLGDEAFWTTGSVGGALYILKGDVTLRVSTGGADSLERTKRLAEMALKNLEPTTR
ncbi:MAG: hypothetical protein M3Y86_07645, partial [Verrucomicrobiota bacterium]|nr:hypothetical protein [Verrucomicrobiota bacterium]